MYKGKFSKRVGYSAGTTSVICIVVSRVSRCNFRIYGF